MNRNIIFFLITSILPTACGTDNMNTPIGQYYENPNLFHLAIRDFFSTVSTKYETELKSLLTLNFQFFRSGTCTTKLFAMRGMPKKSAVPIKERRF